MALVDERKTLAGPPPPPLRNFLDHQPLTGHLSGLSILTSAPLYIRGKKFGALMGVICVWRVTNDTNTCKTQMDTTKLVPYIDHNLPMK